MWMKCLKSFFTLNCDLVVIMSFLLWVVSVSCDEIGRSRFIYVVMFLATCGMCYFGICFCSSVMRWLWFVCR